MLITRTMNAALNHQVGNEFAASLQYISLAAHCSSVGLPIFAAHFFTQAAEERDHAMKFVKYIIEAGGQVEIPAIPAPRTGFATMEEAVQFAF